MWRTAEGGGEQLIAGYVLKGIMKKDRETITGKQSGSQPKSKMSKAGVPETAPAVSDSSWMGFLGISYGWQSPWNQGDF